MNHYDPYGNTLAASGPLAEANLCRFSSKEWHPNLGLVYYLYRYYEPMFQRWVNRDPMEEDGGINLYGFVFNDPANSVDPSGWAIVFVPAGWQGPPAPGDTIVPCPEAPPGVSLHDNMATAESLGFGRQHPTFGRNQLGTMLVQAHWFYDQVKPGGPWDYKRLDPKYEDFGNFNFGAAGSAFGFDSWTLQNEAGIAQQKDPHTRDAGRGVPGSRWKPGSGVPPYGDEPKDNEWIKYGIEYNRQYPVSKGPGPCG